MDWNKKIKIFYDGTDLSKYGSLEYIKGFTTNPTIMKNNNVSNEKYKDFAIKFLEKTRNLPVSFEVFGDNYEDMIEQAREISSWGDNIYVKIPIINTKGVSSSKIIKKLNEEGIKLNITAIFTKDQIKIAYDSLENKNVSNIISIFSGRISDTGIDPCEFIKYGVELTKNNSNIEILWASVREVYNIFHAIKCKCDIITVPDSIFKKVGLIEKDLDQYSLETVKMFYEDSIKTGITFKA